MALTIKQPRDAKSGKVELEYNRLFGIKRSKEINNAQKVIDSEAIRLCLPYMPFDEGTSQKVFILKSVIGSGHLKTGMPYDQKNYYSPQLNFQGAPLRGAYWFERMKTSNKEYIRKKAGKVIK